MNWKDRKTTTLDRCIPIPAWDREPKMNRSNALHQVFLFRDSGVNHPPAVSSRKWSQRCNHPTAMSTSLGIRAWTTWCLGERGVSRLGWFHSQLDAMTCYYHVICWATCDQLDVTHVNHGCHVLLPWLWFCNSFSTFGVFGCCRVLMLVYQHEIEVTGHRGNNESEHDSWYCTILLYRRMSQFLG